MYWIVISSFSFEPRQHAGKPRDSFWRNGKVFRLKGFRQKAEVFGTSNSDLQPSA
jgi:hypothetical protein